MTVDKLERICMYIVVLLSLVLTGVAFTDEFPYQRLIAAAIAILMVAALLLPTAMVGKRHGWWGDDP